MQTLDVLNEMLGTMGEAPLSSLEDAHAYRGAGLRYLTNTSRRIQSRGWWFNMDEVTLSPMENGRIALPNDAMAVRTGSYAYTKRGPYLYDLSTNDYQFTADVPAIIVRLVAFEDLPESAAAYIAAQAVERFQSRYDGDATRTAALMKERIAAYAECNIEHTRNRKSNFILSNPRLARIKMASNRLGLYRQFNPQRLY